MNDGRIAASALAIRSTFFEGKRLLRKAPSLAVAFARDPGWDFQGRRHVSSAAVAAVDVIEKGFAAARPFVHVSLHAPEVGTTVLTGEGVVVGYALPRRKRLIESTVALESVRAVVHAALVCLLSDIAQRVHVRSTDSSRHVAKHTKLQSSIVIAKV
ncbi:hypothetical protein KC340_g118 [Hortaea werneckii]|nr:hypothetical protein KC340_g118 [Hortaea werneckii]